MIVRIIEFDAGIAQRALISYCEFTDEHWQGYPILPGEQEHLAKRTCRYSRCLRIALVFNREIET